MAEHDPDDLSLEELDDVAGGESAAAGDVSCTNTNCAAACVGSP